jgi:hypothetical protein
MIYRVRKTVQEVAQYITLEYDAGESAFPHDFNQASRF